MSWIYIITTWIAAVLLLDDMCLGNIHPGRGIFIMLALVWNTVYTAYKLEKRYK